MSFLPDNTEGKECALLSGLFVQPLDVCHLKQVSAATAKGSPRGALGSYLDWIENHYLSFSGPFEQAQKNAQVKKGLYVCYTSMGHWFLAPKRERIHG